jgi:hypothetical protein
MYVNQNSVIKLYMSLHLLEEKIIFFYPLIFFTMPVYHRTLLGRTHGGMRATV